MGDGGLAVAEAGEGRSGASRTVVGLEVDTEVDLMCFGEMGESVGGVGVCCFLGKSLTPVSGGRGVRGMVIVVSFGAANKG